MVTHIFAGIGALISLIAYAYEQNYGAVLAFSIVLIYSVYNIIINRTNMEKEPKILSPEEWHKNKYFRMDSTDTIACFLKYAEYYYQSINHLTKTK